MPIEPVKIPQNVYVEDRIIGPVTLKQLIITGIGAGISYMLFATVTKAGVTDLTVRVLTWIPAVIAAAFAFLKINDLSLFNIILLIIEGMNKPSVRTWSPHSGLSINVITHQSVKELTEIGAKAADNASRLADVTRQMEKRQEEMNRLANHEMPRPDAVEAVKTRLATSGTSDASNIDTLSGPPQSDDAVSSLPVNPNRIQQDGFDPAKSIDGIAQGIHRYEHLVAKLS